MKNKFKKLIVCICFALIGCFAFSACSSTELKSNIESQIGSVTVATMSLDDLKQMSVGKIMLTAERFENQAYDNVKVSGKSKQENLITCVTVVEGSAEMFIRKKDNVKVVYVSDAANNAQSVVKMDTENNKKYVWDKTSTENFTEYEDPAELYDILNSRFNFNPYAIFGTQFGFDDVKDSIKNVSLKGNTLSCTFSYSNFLDNEEGVEDYYNLVEVTCVFENDYLASIEYNFYHYFYKVDAEYSKDGDGNIVKDAYGKPMANRGSISRCFSQSIKYSYQYSDIDFSKVDAKIAEIEAEYLN